MSEPNNTALLIVDMINNFQFDMGERLAEKTKQIVPRILSLKKHAKQSNWPIIYINDHYGLWKADIDAIREECSNDRSAPIIKDISPQPDDYFLIKPKHSALRNGASHPSDRITSEPINHHGDCREHLCAVHGQRRLYERIQHCHSERLHRFQ